MTVRIKSQFYSKCHLCGGTINQGEMVDYDPNAKRGHKVSHVDCENSEERAQSRRIAELEAEHFKWAQLAIERFGSVKEGAQVKTLTARQHRAMSDMDYTYTVDAGEVGTVTRVVVGGPETTYHGVYWVVTFSHNRAIEMHPHRTTVEVLDPAC